MKLIKLSSEQQNIINYSVNSKIFLEGPTGSGKTTVAVNRIIRLLSEGIRGDSILIIVPQNTLATPYRVIKNPELTGGAVISIQTISGIARKMIEIYWPLIAQKAGFARPDKEPTFLSLETAQYYMANIVKPFIYRGYFQTITIERNRIYSQILDNLNKAALVGFPVSTIGERLKSSMTGEKSYERTCDEVQTCASAFREFCLSHNLLDFSLKIEIFFNYIWTCSACYRHLTETFRHIIVDNIEEDTSVAHDILSEWISLSKSALIIYDTDGGYRSFLGSDPVNAYKLKDVCSIHSTLRNSFITSQNLRAFASELAQSFKRHAIKEQGNIKKIITYKPHRYHIEMLDWVSEEVELLVKEYHTEPEEIVILAPYLTDSLRFSLMNRLEEKNIPARSHRPSRALREEPVTQCLLMLAAIAHPAWGIIPGNFDVAYGLMQSIEDLDLVRAHLIADNLYKTVNNRPVLAPFDEINTELQERITYVLGDRYEMLRMWIDDYIKGNNEELDHFLNRIFGEILSQKGYGFYGTFEQAAIAANLIDSIKKFRKTVNIEGKSMGQEYIEMVQEGLVADQYIRNWEVKEKNSVLLAPAHTFLMMNTPVDYQFWLNIGSGGWWERLYQPLTNPYVMSRQWHTGKQWTDEDEFQINQEGLYRITRGLIYRCRRKIYLGLSELGEQGYEQQGTLLRAIQRVFTGPGGVTVSGEQ